jgi:L-alanine-DL-glutamate epimerase-like enolase superfamily enzyme
MLKSVSTPVTSVTTRTFTVPTDKPEADGTLDWDSTTLVTAEISAGGVTGLGWTYAAAACRSVIEDVLAETVIGQDVLSVPACHEAMVRACRNFGRPGVVSCAISAMDIALWDCKARLLGVSLADLFGRCTDGVDLYGSGGFTTYDDATTTAQLEHWVGECGFERVKIKIGESGGSQSKRDLARVDLARRIIGDEVELYVDANGAYTRKQAVRLGREMIERAGVTWFEEPVSSDDLVGLSHIRQQLQLDVAAGEYGYDETYFARMISAEAVDCLQLDVTRCGGYTSWLRGAALAGAHGLDISAHCAPNLHAHVAISVPRTRHIEYFHDHARIESWLFDGALEPLGGKLHPAGEIKGHGMSIREKAAEPFRQ